MNILVIPDKYLNSGKSLAILKCLVELQNIATLITKLELSKIEQNVGEVNEIEVQSYNINDRQT